MEKTMRGIVKETAGPGLAFRGDLPVPEVGVNEALIKIKAAAICGTDVHIDHWNEWAAKRIKPPTVVGHEVAGEVVAIGSEVKDLRVGDRVAVETHIPCYQCELCAKGLQHICDHQDVFGVTIPGGFAEYAKVRADVCVKLPAHISDEEGAMLEAMGAGVHGVERAELKGKTVLINGCGPIGLMSIGAAKVHGATKIIATDIFDEKLEVAKQMGADIVWNSKEIDILQAAKDATNGLGMDAAIDYSGFGPAIVNTLKTLRKGGRLVLVGLPDGLIPINLSEDLIYREIEVVGISGREMYYTWDDCIEIIADERFSLEPVIGGRYALEDYRKALDDIAGGAPGKMLLIPSRKPE